MSKPKFAFDILFNSDLSSFCNDKTLAPIDKKKILGRTRIREKVEKLQKSSCME